MSSSIYSENYSHGSFLKGEQFYFYMPEKTDLLYVCTGPDPVKAVDRCVEDPGSEQTRCRQQANTTHPRQ